MSYPVALDWGALEWALLLVRFFLDVIFVVVVIQVLYVGDSV